MIISPYRLILMYPNDRVWVTSPFLILKTVIADNCFVPRCLFLHMKKQPRI